MPAGEVSPEAKIRIEEDILLQKNQSDKNVRIVDVTLGLKMVTNHLKLWCHWLSARWHLGLVSLPTGSSSAFSAMSGQDSGTKKVLKRDFWLRAILAAIKSSGALISMTGLQS